MILDKIIPFQKKKKKKCDLTTKNKKVHFTIQLQKNKKSLNFAIT